ncbi:MAG: aldo/keto reductase, partial [Clostridium sartagoforme]|nr:aldo/keto reductase [Clostridium sartagoforme]
MKKLTLGNSDLQVSNIGLGGINFGTKTNEATSFKIIDTYIKYGGNFIDTANNYAVWNGGNGGESEKVIGKFIAGNYKREDLVIATKVGALPKSLSKRDFSNMQGLSRKVIIESVNKSLENLKTDYIDLLYLHVDDFKTPQEETLETLNELINSGLVKEIGCSNFHTWRIESARRICKENGYRFFSAVQQRYSYLTPVIEADFYPQVPCNKDLESYINYYNDMTLVAYSPLLSGQYNNKNILKKEYNTLNNKEKLEKLLKEEHNPNKGVVDYITKQFNGSVALLTTSNI